MVSWKEEPPLGRSIIAAVAWAFAWYAAAIALSFEIASHLQPDALNSRFFYMWTFARSLAWLVAGIPAGIVFVFVEWWVRGERTREASVAGWRALALGAAVGLLVVIALALLDTGPLIESLDTLAVAFGLVAGASCGLLTFLAERSVLRFAAKRRRATT